MSTALAVASVTAVLKDLLNNGLIDHDVSSALGDVTVSALPPDRVDALDNEKKSRLNLFLFQVTHNAGWRNVALPSRDSNGDRINNPPLALDLHYLLTAYGMEEFHAEILLGYGMQLLHETPVLTRAAIRRSLAPPTFVTGGSGLPPGMESLFTSQLAEQVEQIKIVPQTLTTEEISRMWTAFQAKYRPTSAYQATVVLIESRQPSKTALPVQKRLIFAVPTQQPVIGQILSQKTAADPILDQPILPGFRLVITGQSLRGDDTLIDISGTEITPVNADLTDTQATVPLPASLPAGVQSVQVIHRRMLGEPPVAHRGVESNAAAFLLQPNIDSITAVNVTGAGAAPRSADIHVTVHPAVGAAQRVMLLLNEVGGTGAAFTFTAPPRVDPPANDLVIPITGVKAATYAARVQVDGAQSVLGTDATGQFNGPPVAIP